MTDLNPKIIERIQKLLALANDGGATEAEAELAMAKALEMMLAHNLSIATIEASGGAKEGRAKERNSQNLMYPWKRSLLESIAKVNFCHVSLLAKRTRSGQSIGAGYELIGRESNIVATKNMFSYLLDTIERLIVAEVGTSPQERFTRWSHSFRLGCSDRLQSRLLLRHEEQLIAQMKAAKEAEARGRHPASATGNALVVVMRDFAQAEEDLNDDLRMGWNPGTTANNRERNNRQAQALQEAFTKRYNEIVEIEPDIDRELARYLAKGWSRERAMQVLTPKHETPSARRRREEAEARANDRYWRAQDNRANKIDSSGYRKGQSSAEKVGLDGQVTHSPSKRIG